MRKKKPNRPIVNQRQINIDRAMGRVERPVYTIVPTDDSVVFDADDAQAIYWHEEAVGRRPNSRRLRWQKSITNFEREHEDWPFVPAMMVRYKPFVLPVHRRVPK